jgi:hypothetical protein
MTDLDDVTTHAALAIGDALTDDAKERILAKFRTSNLNGAPVADILDILDNGDALLELREPFYEDGGADQAHWLLGWEPYSDDEPRTYEVRLRHRLIGFATLALALLDDAVPKPPFVAALASMAAAVAESRWPGGQYVSTSGNDS